MKDEYRWFWGNRRFAYRPVYIVPHPDGFLIGNRLPGAEHLEFIPHGELEAWAKTQPDRAVKPPPFSTPDLPLEIDLDLEIDI
jgi:hypothetical protein